MSIAPDQAPEVPVSPGVPRRRIHPTFLDELKRSLGNRDFAKGERAHIHEILTHMRSQASASGYPSAPIVTNDQFKPVLDEKNRPVMEDYEDEDTGAMMRRPKMKLHRRADTPEERKYKEAKLDGVRRMFDEHPELMQDDEHQVIELLLHEAAMHDLRPHAGHARAVPTHLAEAERQRRAKSDDQRRRDELQHARLEAAKQGDGANQALAVRVADLEKRLDDVTKISLAGADKLDAILAHLQKPADAPPPPPPTDKAG